jgi:hypothetical protein
MDNAPKYLISEADAADMANRFMRHHIVSEDEKSDRLLRMSGQTQSLAELYLMNVPPGRERSLAITKLEEAVMWANAGISRGE